MSDAKRELELVTALERAHDRGCVREYADLEAFAGAVLEMIGQEDTPVNRAKLQFGSGGDVRSLMAGAESHTYFIAVIPPSARYRPGESLFIERPETNARILVCVVDEETERDFAAKTQSR